MAYETLIVEVDDHVALIKLNRPDAMNALNAQVVSELSKAILDLEANERARCVILAGSEKSFSSGMEVGEFADKGFADVFGRDPFGPLVQQFSSRRKPIIAAVSGYAMGCGCELAMMCDFIICSETAKFGHPEVNLGVTSGMGGTQRLTRAVGKSKAMDMHLTGRFMTAEEAERSGLVSRVVPAKKLLEEARAAAQKIAEKSRLTTLALREAVDRSFETGLTEGLLFERRLFQAMFATSDQSEGMSAFLEKRDPQFRDK